MSCYCSNTSFTCNNASFSAPLPTHCALTSLKPSIPVHFFNLICPSHCTPIVLGSSTNHGISCNMYNGYSKPVYIFLPGHTTSCASCASCTTPSPCTC